MMKEYRNKNVSNSVSIPNKAGQVVNEMVTVWQKHFANLCKVNDNLSFVVTHYNYVTEEVKRWYIDDDMDQFLVEPFNETEVCKAVKRLNKGKSAGFDGVSSEHLQNAGELLYNLLTYFPQFQDRNSNTTL